MNNTALALYRDMVIERHRIWEARQRDEPYPWTTNSVLMNLKMTNMFRVLDPGSQFVFHLDNGHRIDLIARLVFYRMTNKPSTWYMMRDVWGDFPTASDFVHKNAHLFQMLDAYRQAGNRIFSGAYIILPEPGTKNDKVGGALRVVRHFVTEKGSAFMGANSSDEQFDLLRSIPGIGPFLSMQILTDWMYLQHSMPDLSFVVAGPGAIRGAALIDPHQKAENLIYDLTVDWMEEPAVRLMGRPLTPMDVQNTLCEFSKYAREMATPRRKNPYKPAHPGPQSAPILPWWW